MNTMSLNTVYTTVTVLSLYTAVTIHAVTAVSGEMKYGIQEVHGDGLTTIDLYGDGLTTMDLYGDGLTTMDLYGD